MTQASQQFQKALLLLDRGDVRGPEELRAVVERTDAPIEVAVASRVCLAELFVDDGALDEAGEVLGSLAELTIPSTLDDVLDMELRRADELRAAISGRSS